jgi:Tol biopolymer transport system component
VNVSVSPDARWLAYDIALSGNARDIYVASLDGGAETVAVQDAANDHHPMWSPDGSKLIFVSDRTRNNSLWSLAMSAGKPTGALELLRADLGTFTPFGITQTGAIIYTSGGYSNNIGGGLTNIYIGPLDSDSNPAGEPALATKQFLNSNAFPSWSPDGTRLAYFSQRAPYDTANPIVLVVRDVKSSVETVIPTKLSLNDNQIAWAPDGKSVLVAGALGEMRGLYRVTLETGAEQLLMPTPFNRFSLSSDGKMLYYMKANNVDRVQAIWRRDLATGSEIELKRRPQDDRRPFTSMAVSPDGTEVAYVIRDDANRTGSIEVIPASGGTSREVLRSPLWIGGSPAAGLAWTPDGKNILYAHAEPSFGHFIWRVPAQGGEPVNLGFGIKGTPQTRTAGYMSVNPNGRSIAFTASDQSVSEVWALENILPASSVR